MKRAFLLFAFAFCIHAASSDRSVDVRLDRVPNGGIQPQVAVSGGVVHLIYYSGDPMAGDLFYVTSSDGGERFSKPLRVNSHPGSAIAAGNIRGAHIAVGRNGTVHVAWNGSKDAEPKGPAGATPMLYTRLIEKSTAFEPERNVIQTAYGLDGGGSLAANQAGNVFVFWHAPTPGAKGEENRRVWMARSTDDGKTFAKELPVSNTPTGVCGCCGMHVTAAADGSLFALYRSATATVNRDMYLLASHDHGRSFSSQKIDAWRVGYCVMSSVAFSSSQAGTLAAWETQGKTRFARLDNGPIAIHSSPSQSDKQKHPAIATSADGRTLVAWTEGMAWKKGGSLAWQIYDSNWKPIGEAGHADGVPAWSLIAAIPRADGGFIILY